MSCDDGIACTFDSCDSSNGSCQHQDTCTGGQSFTCGNWPNTYTCYSEYECNHSTGQCTVSSCCF
jgi:hypothetical protein